MKSSSFSEQIRQKTDNLWTATLNHPFIKGIGSGTLEQNRYEFYLKQDYVYLIEFARVFALAATKAQQLADMDYFSNLLNATLNIEMDLHRKTCANFGISASDLEKTESAMITTSYTNLLIRTCYEGTLSDILSVLLPCAAGYVEIGQYLKSQGLPQNQYYRSWIETYSSTEFVEYANWLKIRLDQFAEKSSEEDKERYYKHYLASSRFELLFFEMSWNMEMWPNVVLI